MKIQSGGIGGRQQTIRIRTSRGSGEGQLTARLIMAVPSCRDTGSENASRDKPYIFVVLLRFMGYGLVVFQTPGTVKTSIYTHVGNTPKIPGQSK